MKKVLLCLTMFLFTVFPVLVKADNSECIFKNLTEKSSYVPGEIITIEYGLTPMPSNSVGYGIEFYIGFDSYYFEAVKQSNNLVTTTNGWENNSSKILENFGYGDLDYTFIEVKSDTLDETKYMTSGTIYDEPYIVGNIKLKVKEKVNSGLAQVVLAHNSSDGSLMYDKASKFNQYILNDDDTTEDYTGECFENTEMNLKIVNKDDDAYISSIKITYYGDETTTKEITDLSDLVYEEEVSKDITKIKIEAKCLGTNCKVKGLGEFSIEEGFFPLIVESDTSVRNYSLYIYNNDQQNADVSEISEEISSEEISTLTTTNKKNSSDDRLLVYGIAFGILLLIVIVVLILVNKNKDSKEKEIQAVKEEPKKDDVNAPYIPIERDENGNIINTETQVEAAIDDAIKIENEETDI